MIMESTHTKMGLDSIERLLATNLRVFEEVADTAVLLQQEPNCKKDDETDTAHLVDYKRP